MRTNINLNYFLTKCFSNFKITFVSAVLSLLITILLFFYAETRIVLKNSFYVSKTLYITLLKEDPVLLNLTSNANQNTTQDGYRSDRITDLLKYSAAIKLTDVILDSKEDSYGSKIKFRIFQEKKKLTDFAQKKNYQLYFINDEENKNYNLIQFEIMKIIKNRDFKILDGSDLLLFNKEVKKIVYQLILDEVRTIDKNFNLNIDDYIFHTYFVNKTQISHFRYISTCVFLLIFINFIIVFIKFRKKILI